MKSIKLFTLMLSMVMLLCLAACDNNGTPTDTPTDASTDAPTDAPADMPTEPVETDPPVPLFPTSGYCAVGEVRDGRVAVLAGNGMTAVFEYIGDTAPTSGILYTYECDGDFILFTELNSFPDFAADKQGWVWGSTGGNVYYGSAFNTTPESVFFLRYSATDWRVCSGSFALISDGVVTGGYMYSVDGDKIGAMMIVGDCNSLDALTPATKAQTFVFDPSGEGWDEGNISLVIK